MPPNPLIVASREARRDDRWLKRAFARYLGSAKHPRGAVLSAYRKARRAMKSALSPGAKLAPTDVLFGLRSELTGIAFASLRAASTRGFISGLAQAAAYVTDGARIIPLAPITDRDAFLDAWLSVYDAQERTVTALIKTGDSATIVGDASRMGALAPGVMLKEGARWIATSLNTAAETGMGEPLGDRWGKQALPNIDDVTTDTCLNVAGQIQPLDEPFQLYGTPRFADELDWSPFHWNCRTSVVLYRSDFDKTVTQNIRTQVRTEREQRLTAPVRTTRRRPRRTARPAMEQKAVDERADIDVLRRQIQADTHSLQDVIEGRAPVGVEGRGGKDVAEARRLGLYVTKANGITVFARSERAARPLVDYLEAGGKYGTPEFSRLLGYTKRQIRAYRRFLRAVEAAKK